MSHYTNQEFDFISRTKKIIEQYNDIKLPENEKFEITLLINCLVGLLILPQQNWFDMLPSGYVISQKEWGINKKHIHVIKNGEMMDVKNIARHLRNSIAHYRFKAFENKSTEISSVSFKDYDQQGNITFDATIPIPSIRQFTKKLTDTLLTQMKV